MEMISYGIRWGLCEHYRYDISRLTNELVLEEMKDDYVNFKKTLNI